jgi:hypothetical protein
LASFAVAAAVFDRDFAFALAAKLPLGKVACFCVVIEFLSEKGRPGGSDFLPAHEIVLGVHLDLQNSTCEGGGLIAVRRQASVSALILRGGAADRVAESRSLPSFT